MERRSVRERKVIGQFVALLIGGLLLMLIGWQLWRQVSPKPSMAAHHVEPKKWSLPPTLQQQLAQAGAVPPNQAQILFRKLTRLPARTSEEKYVVGYAHYQIGKLHAEQKQFRAAQQAFQQLAARRLNVSALPLDPSFGTWSEQGAYQAAICAYQLDPQQGIEQMIRFIEEHPDSPLVIGAYKRILRWTNEKPPVAAQHAWQQAQAAQKERMKRAAACGPKALAYVLKHEFGIDARWQALMKECGTELEGTSLWALAQAARKRGLSAVGLEVSHKGLLEQEPPFLVWNPIGHYVAVVNRGGKWQIYDPAKGSLQPWLEESLPDAWRGAILLLRPRTLAKQTEGGIER